MMSVRVDRYTVTDVSKDRGASVFRVKRCRFLTPTSPMSQRNAQQHVCRTKRLLTASKNQCNTDPRLVMRNSAPVTIKYRNTASG